MFLHLQILLIIPGFADDDLDRLMGSANDTLEYIKSEAVPFVQKIMDDYIKNEAIQEEGKKIVACFGYHFCKRWVH